MIGGKYYALQYKEEKKEKKVKNNERTVFNFKLGRCRYCTGLVFGVLNKK